MAFNFGTSSGVGGAAPVFGAAPPASTASAFNFSSGGASTSTALPAFGTATSTAAAPAFGGFGTTPATSSTAPSFGAFGAGTSTASTGFGGGFAAPAAAGQSAFGAPTSKPLGFGGGFGTGTAAPTLGFGTAGSSFGAPVSSSSSFGGFGKPGGAFGTGTATGGLFAPQSTLPGLGTSSQSFGAFGPPQPQQQRTNPVEQLYGAVLQCSLFGDERDTIIARWNMLQASWGIGKVFHSTTMPPLDLTAENPLCRFKTIGYSALPSSRNEDGILSAVIKKKASELTPQKNQIVSTLHAILGNKPTMKVVVDGIRSLTQDSSEVLFYVQESNPQNGHKRKVPTNEIFGFLSQPMNSQNLQKNGFDSVTPKVSFTKEQIKEYLENPPQGIDPRLWKQAQLDNPNPKALIPVPMIGFKALQHRIQCQDLQAKTFQGRLDSIAEQISDLQKRHQDTLAKMRDAKRRHLSLSHRVLHVMVKQEETRKIGFSIQPEEEKLRIQLEALQSEMSAPTQFKGRLNELISQVRHQSQVSAMNGCEKYSMDPFLQQDVKNVLKQQQEGIQALMKVIKEDLGDLNSISDALEEEANRNSKQF